MSSFNIYDHATQKQIDNFKPTFLYIKQHSVTGKLYFGKTIKLKYIETYNGSGVVWTHHIKKHAKDHVITLWYCLFTDIESLVQTAITLSETQNIVESDNWGNLMNENGLSGGDSNNHTKQKTTEYRSLMSAISTASQATRTPKQKAAAIEQGRKLGLSGKGKKKSAQMRSRLSKSTTGVPKSDETKAKLTIIANDRPIIKCCYCNITATALNIKRWHDDNCKYSPLFSLSIAISRTTAAKLGATTYKNRNIQRPPSTQRRKCTIDGITIYESKTEMIATIGSGKTGSRSPDFRFVD